MTGTGKINLRDLAMYKRYYIFILVLLLKVQGVNGQFYETGQPPASVRWQQINTGNFRIIYPETFGPRALRLASLLEESWQLTGHSLGHQPRKIPVLVHNHAARSNGLVSWAPRRMELYPVPPQDARGNEWLLQLAVHEQRHVVQVDRLNRGTTKALSRVLGEQAHGIGIGRLPLWFLEGDAVVTETALTLSGRGRRPSFDMPLRALLLSRPDNYSYDKFLFRSYKDYVPDHYIYGYQMAAGLREEFGPGIWQEALENIAQRPVFPAPFAGSLKEQTGSAIGELHEKTMERLRNEWGITGVEQGKDEGQVLNRRDRALFTNYRYPLWMGDSAVIALKSGIAQTDEFVIIDLEGNERSVHFPGILSSPTFSLSGNSIAWSEFQPDIRWGLRQYSVVKVLDINTGTERQISNESRYYSPVFAPDMLFLAVVEVDLQNSHFLLLMNSVTGEVAERYHVPGDIAIQQPVFNPAGKEMLVTFTGRDGTGIMALDRETGQWETVLGPYFINISGIFMAEGYLCFRSDHAGKDDLFALDRGSGEVYRLTSSRFGAFDGNFLPSGRQMVYAGYTADGFNLVKRSFEISEDLPVSLTDQNYGDLPGLLASHEKGIMMEDCNGSMWQPEPYRKGLNLFRFHSWAPFYYDYSDFNISGQPVYPGISLLSQNLLNTANTFLGYSYREGRHIAHGSFIYKGWYPVIEAGFDYGDEPLVFMGRDTIGPQNSASYNHLNLKGTACIPLNLSNGRIIAGAEPWLGLNYSNNLYHYDDDDSYERGMTTIETRFIAYRYHRRSYRDIAPRWGQVFRWRRIIAPFESENLGTLSAVELTFYFPGLLPHHSLRLDAGLQNQKPVKYLYSGVLGFPRGYGRERSERLRVIRGRYAFPFLYPDLSLPTVLYLSRLNGGLFAGTGINSNRVFDESARRRVWRDETLFSWGAEITANFHLLRIVFPFNMSAGFAHIPARGETSFLFSLGMDINIF